MSEVEAAGADFVWDFDTTRASTKALYVRRLSKFTVDAATPDFVRDFDSS